jgi:hypothetical protein
VLVGGFVKNYMIWMYHGENAPPRTDNPLDEIIQDVQFDRMFDAYDDFDVGGSDDDGSDDELDDGDFLSQLLCYAKRSYWLVVTRG